MSRRWDRCGRPEPRMYMRGFFGIAAALAVATASAQDAPDADETHPVFSTDPSWVRPTLVGVAALFAAAGGIGSLVWLRARDTVPVAATHEEDPAADRH